MPIEYLLNDKRYVLSYSELRDKYQWFIELSDSEFMKRLSEAMHFACIVCWMKEIPSHDCLSDEGVIHQLAHMMHIPEEPLIRLSDVRHQFKTTLELK